jgi:hypothetical protein
VALEALEGKMAFSEGSGGICGFFEWRGVLAQKDRYSHEVWKIFRDFWWIFGVAMT